jgi:hypothetical protein
MRSIGSRSLCQSRNAVLAPGRKPGPDLNKRPDSSVRMNKSETPARLYLRLYHPSPAAVPRIQTAFLNP